MLLIMHRISREIALLGSIRKKTLVVVLLLASLLLSTVLTAFDNLVSGFVDGINGTHQYDPRKQ